MDYIREELLRQRAVLARLLLGVSDQTAEQEQERAFADGEVSEEDAVLRAEEALFLGSRVLAAGERIRLSRGIARTSAEEQRAAYLDLLQELSEAALGHGSRYERAEYGSVRSGGGQMEAAMREAYALAGEEETAPLRRNGVLRDSSGRRYVLRNGGMEKTGRNTVEREETLLPEVQTVTEVVGYSGGETESARDLSRVFQRDARRYDGGFTLY